MQRVRPGCWILNKRVREKHFKKSETLKFGRKQINNKHTSKKFSVSSNRSCVDLLSPSESVLSSGIGGLITFLASNGSTTTCSVPLISVRQKGQPCPSQSYTAKGEARERVNNNQQIMQITFQK